MWELQLKHKLSWHPLHIVRAKPLGLSRVETTNKGLLDRFGSDGTIKDEVPTWASVTTENFDTGLRRIVNCDIICVENGVIMLRNDTLSNFHIVLYMK